MDMKAYISSGIIEQYVLGLCTDAEAQELEQLRSLHPELNQAITAFEEALETRLQQEPVLPSTGTDERILFSLSQLNNPDKDTPFQAVPVKRFNLYKWAAAAALVVLAGSAYLNYALIRKNKEQEIALEKWKEQPQTITSLPPEDYKIITSAGITPVAMYGVGIHAICRCTMFWDKKTGKAYIIIHHLPQTNEQRDYQLWAYIDGKPVSAGIINDAIRGRFIEMQGIPDGATQFSVTLENAGGSATPNEADIYLQGRI